MSKLKPVLLIMLAAIFIVGTFNAHNIYAIFWKAENAVVILSNCSSNCELRGTLRVMPFDGRYFLESGDTNIYLNDGSYESIFYPGEQEKQ